MRAIPTSDEFFDPTGAQHSVRIFDHHIQESLARYLAQPPLSLNKIRYEPLKGRALFHTTYSEYFKQNVKLFEALDFIR